MSQAADELCADTCPFLGPKPDATAILEFDVEPPWSPSSFPHDPRMRNVRRQLGFGPRWFDTLGLRRPHGLEYLTFNDDPKYGVVPERQGDLILAVGGAWDAVIDAITRVARLIESDDCKMRAVHVGQHSERDHIGFLDGTSNLQELSADAFAESVMVSAADDPAYAGGSHLVLRKYVEDLHLWEDLQESVQEAMVGRVRSTGTFLDGNLEWSETTWHATHPRAHVRRVRPRGAPEHWTDRIFRRSATFSEWGPSGELVQGLLFIALVRDPVRQVVRIHNELLLPEEGPRDLLLGSGYVTPVATGCWYLPPRSRVPDLLGGSPSSS